MLDFKDPEIGSNKGLKTFCERWGIVRLELFGSLLRGTEHSTSDVDVLVTFDRNCDWSLFDLLVMEEQLSQLSDRKVDLVCRESVEKSPNWIRRREILESAKLLYAA